jgi:hypothetical protein
MQNIKWHFFSSITIAPMNYIVHCTQLWLYTAQNCVYCDICPLLSPSVFVITIFSWSHLIFYFVFVWFCSNIIFFCVLLNFFYFVGFQFERSFSTIGNFNRLKFCPFSDWYNSSSILSKWFLFSFSSRLSDRQYP